MPFSRPVNAWDSCLRHIDQSLAFGDCQSGQVMVLLCDSFEEEEVFFIGAKSRPRDNSKVVLTHRVREFFLFIL